MLAKHPRPVINALRDTKQAFLENSGAMRNSKKFIGSDIQMTEWLQSHDMYLKTAAEGHVGPQGGV